MATYKVIQDIEADDKFVGPLTLKQFVFAAGGAVGIWISFIVIMKGAPIALLFTAPPTLLGFFLAVPWSKDQPTEVWVLAKIRFYFKPRIHIWNQDGQQDLVTVTVPKKIEKRLTKDLNPHQVESRLKILADTIDSRGWSIKNSSALQRDIAISSDRLIDVSALPRQVPTLAKGDISDPMDATDSPIANQFSSMIQANQRDMRKEAIAKMEQARAEATTPAPSTQVSLPAPPPVQSSYTLPVPTPQASTATPPNEESVLAEQLKQKAHAGEEAMENMHTIPTSPQILQKTDTEKPQTPVPDTANAGIINLSQNNDLNIETIARQANRGQSDDEVVVSLH